MMNPSELPINDKARNQWRSQPKNFGGANDLGGKCLILGE